MERFEDLYDQTHFFLDTTLTTSEHDRRLVKKLEVQEKKQKKLLSTLRLLRYGEKM